MDGTGDSPQKRGAAKRAATRKAQLAGTPTSSGTKVQSTYVAVSTAEPSTGDSVRMLFAVTQEEDMLAVSRCLRAIGRVHTVDVSPYGFILTRTAD